MIIVLMGVSGSGKTTVGEALARRLGARFVEGDRLHPPENVKKMSIGIPLEEADREPWLRAIRAEMDAALAAGESIVVGCSALSRWSREMLGTERDAVKLVHLTAPRSVIAQRLDDRKGHFMPPGLLDSQLAALQAPDDALSVSVDQSVDAIVDEIAAALGA